MVRNVLILIETHINCAVYYEHASIDGQAQVTLTIGGNAASQYTTVQVPSPDKWEGKPANPA